MQVITALSPQTYVTRLQSAVQGYNTATRNGSNLLSRPLTLVKLHDVWVSQFLHIRDFLSRWIKHGVPLLDQLERDLQNSKFTKLCHEVKIF